MKIIIPFSDTDEYRRRVLGYVITLHNMYGFDCIVGEIPNDEPWSKGRAVRAAIKDLPNEELIAITDADVFIGEAGLLWASLTASEHGAWVIPHLRVCRLSQGLTGALLAGEDWPGEEWDRQPYIGVPGGGMVVLTVGQYRECPIDPRFIGWGSEDHAWGYALYGMFGNPIRGTEDLLHFWHPASTQKGYGRLGSDPNNNLRKKYFQAIHKPDVLRRLIADGQTY